MTPNNDLRQRPPIFRSLKSSDEANSLQSFNDIAMRVMKTHLSTKKEGQNRVSKIQSILKNSNKSEKDAQYIHSQIKDMSFFNRFVTNQGLQTLDENSMLEISKSLRYEKYFKGEMVFEENDPSYGKFYIIFKGTAYIYQTLLKSSASHNEVEREVEQEEKNVHYDLKIDDVVPSASSSESQEGEQNSPFESNISSYPELKLKRSMTMNYHELNIKASSLTEHSKHFEEKNEDSVENSYRRITINAKNSVKKAEPAQKTAKELSPKNFVPRRMTRNLTVQIREKIHLHKVEGYPREPLTSPKRKEPKVSYHPSISPVENKTILAYVEDDIVSRSESPLVHRFSRSNSQSITSESPKSGQKLSPYDRFSRAKKRILTIMNNNNNNSISKFRRNPTIDLNDRVQQYGKLVGKIMRGMSFGELALNDENSKRNATMFAATDLELLVLSSNDLSSICERFYKRQQLKRQFMLEYFAFLEKITSSSISKGIDSYIYLLKEEVFPLDGIVCKEGEKSDKCYALFEGQCNLFKSIVIKEKVVGCSTNSMVTRYLRANTNKTEKLLPISIIDKGSFIGEEILFNSDGKYEFTVKVTSQEATLFSINKSVLLVKLPRITVDAIASFCAHKRAKHLQSVEKIIANRFPSLQVDTSAPMPEPKKKVEDIDSEKPKKKERRRKKGQEKEVIEIPISQKQKEWLTVAPYKPIVMVSNLRVEKSKSEKSHELLEQDYKSVTTIDGKINLSDYIKLPRQLDNSIKAHTELRGNAKISAFEQSKLPKYIINKATNKQEKTIQEKLNSFRETIDYLADIEKTKGSPIKIIFRGDKSEEADKQQPQTLTERNLLKQEKLTKRKKQLRNKDSLPLIPMVEYYDKASKVQPELGIKRSTEPKIEDFKWNFGRAEEVLVENRYAAIKNRRYNISSPRKNSPNQVSSIKIRNFSSSKKENDQLSDRDSSCYSDLLPKARKNSRSFKVKQDNKQKHFSKFISLTSSSRESSLESYQSTKYPNMKENMASLRKRTHDYYEDASERRSTYYNQSINQNESYSDLMITSPERRFSSEDLFRISHSLQEKKANVVKQWRNISRDSKDEIEHSQASTRISNLLFKHKERTCVKQKGLLRETISGQTYNDNLNWSNISISNSSHTYKFQ